MVGHRFSKWRGFHVQVCDGCGLIALSNDLTREAVRLGCDYKYHPSWKKLVRQHTAHNGEPT